MKRTANDVDITNATKCRSVNQTKSTQYASNEASQPTTPATQFQIQSQITPADINGSHSVRIWPNLRRCCKSALPWTLLSCFQTGNQQNQSLSGAKASSAITTGMTCVPSHQLLPSDRSMACPDELPDHRLQLLQNCNVRPSANS